MPSHTLQTVIRRTDGIDHLPRSILSGKMNDLFDFVNEGEEIIWSGLTAATSTHTFVPTVVECSSYSRSY